MQQCFVPYAYLPLINVDYLIFITLQRCSNLPSMQILTSACQTRAPTARIVTIFRMHSVVPVIPAGREQDVKMVTIFLPFY